MMADVRMSRLKNGTRIVSSLIPYVESASIGIWVGVGGRFESRKMAGACHFIEHMLFKGTKNRSAKTISNEIEGRGGYLNAFTQEESTCYYAKVACDKVWIALDVLSDMYLNPLFNSNEIEKERGVIIEEIMMYRDQPQHMVHDMLGEAMWINHPLGVPIIGFPETVRGMSCSNIVGYWKDKYVSDNTVFAFAGKVDHDACVARVEEFVEGRKKKVFPEYLPVTSRVRQKDLTLAHKDIEQSHLALGFRLFGRNDKRRYVLRVLNAILGENMSSRLFQVVREKHGLAYSIHSACHLYKDSGALVISAGLDKKRFFKGLELTVREIDRLRNQKVGRRELSRAKEYITGQLRLGLENTSSQMMYIGEGMMSYGKFIPPAEVIRSVNSVSADDVYDLACSIFTRPKASVSLISSGVGSNESRQIRKIVGCL